MLTAIVSEYNYYGDVVSLRLIGTVQDIYRQNAKGEKKTQLNELSNLENTDVLKSYAKCH